MTQEFPTVKGTRDFYPPDWAFFQWLFAKMREVSQRFGFQEYEGPALELQKLYALKSGEELVKEQTFVLMDRGGRKLALRPELTPTLARMVAKKRFQLSLPLRWFSIGRRWRYEQPQKGRAREFFQWDLDLIGSNKPEADAEVIAVGIELLKALGLSSRQVVFKINNRRLMDFKFSLIHIKKTQVPQIFRAIDKKERMSETEWESYLADLGLEQAQVQDLKGILADRDFARESEELTAVFSTLEDFGVGKFVEFDPTIVRGLDYYTGTVFEAREKQGEIRAIFGGGRYDNLVEVVGGPPLPGVGFAAGDMTLQLLLEKYQKIPTLPLSPTKVLITVFAEATFRDSLKLSRKLREKDINAELYLDPETNLGKQLKYANQKQIPYVIILGPEEIEKNVITLKWMKEDKQEVIPFEQLLSFLCEKND